MEKVFVFKSGFGYRAEPPTVVVGGGDNFQVVNATAVDVIVTLPRGAAHPANEVEVNIPSGKKRPVPTRSQGRDTTLAYEYDIKTARGKRVKGNSDPILIIEN